MATLGSKLLTKEMQWNANMTEQNHLGASLLAKPHVMTGAMDKLFSSQNYYSDNPLSSILMGVKGKEETIGGTEWEWEMKGANTRPLITLENLEVGNATPTLFSSCLTTFSFPDLSSGSSSDSSSFFSTTSMSLKNICFFSRFFFFFFLFFFRVFL